MTTEPDLRQRPPRRPRRAVPHRPAPVPRPAALRGRHPRLPCPDAADPVARSSAPEQKKWFKKAVPRSSAKWKLWASELMVMSVDAPAPGQAAILDSWDGYQAERSEILTKWKQDGPGEPRRPDRRHPHVHRRQPDDHRPTGRRPDRRRAGRRLGDLAGAAGVPRRSRRRSSTALRVAADPHIKYADFDRRGYAVLKRRQGQDRGRVQGGRRADQGRVAPEPREVRGRVGRPDAAPDRLGPTRCQAARDRQRRQETCRPPRRGSRGYLRAPKGGRLAGSQPAAGRGEPDPLTRLPTRRQFLDRLGEEIESLEASEGSIAGTARRHRRLPPDQPRPRPCRRRSAALLGRPPVDLRRPRRRRRRQGRRRRVRRHEQRAWPAVPRWSSWRARS